MYHHHILEMTRAISTSLHLSPEQEALVDQAIQACWQDKIAVVWCVEDIQLAAEENHRCRLREEDAAHILDRILETHDAELGITWDTIYWCIDEAIESGVDTIRMTEEVESETQIV
jgi:hypothetical protein